MYSIRNDNALKQESLYVKEFFLIYGTAPRISPLTLFGRHDRFGIEILMLCANALCQNLR